LSNHDPLSGVRLYSVGTLLTSEPREVNLSAYFETKNRGDREPIESGERRERTKTDTAGERRTRLREGVGGYDLIG
jgi:hypothetical protein